MSKTLELSQDELNYLISGLDCMLVGLLAKREVVLAGNPPAGDSGEDLEWVNQTVGEIFVLKAKVEAIFWGRE